MANPSKCQSKKFPAMPQPEKNHNQRNPPRYTDQGYISVPNIRVFRDIEPDGFPNTPLQKFPAVTNCFNCNLLVTTYVDKSLSGEGWTWVILCCCCGSWIISLLVLCMDVFSEYIHYCPRCSKILAIYKPGKNLRIITIFSLLSIGIIGLQLFLIFYYFLPMA